MMIQELEGDNIAQSVLLLINFKLNNCCDWWYYPYIIVIVLQQDAENKHCGYWMSFTSGRTGKAWTFPLTACGATVKNVWNFTWASLWCLPSYPW